MQSQAVVGASIGRVVIAATVMRVLALTIGSTPRRRQRTLTDHAMRDVNCLNMHSKRR